MLLLRDFDMKPNIHHHPHIIHDYVLSGGNKRGRCHQSSTSILHTYAFRRGVEGGGGSITKRKIKVDIFGIMENEGSKNYFGKGRACAS